MTRTFHFLRLAMRNLRRGGQRVIVALLCITFGVMSLVAMTMLARSIASAIEVPPAQLLGGDISMGRNVEDTLSPQHVEQLEALQESGEISGYTLIAYNSSSIVFRTPGSGELHFAGIGLGIEPDRYPLAGSLAIEGPGNTDLPSILQRVGDVVVTRDLAEEYDLDVGDAVILADLRVGIPLEGTLRGIAYDTPNHQGDKIYYSIETAQELANGQPVVNTVIANAPQALAVAARLGNSGWWVDWVASQDGESAGNMWVIGLRSAGILGLLVGGIGIANTMQVLLHRRQREIAIWKTLGYRQSDLRLIYSLEALLLGLAGSLLGAGLGVLVSTGLLDVFLHTSSLLYQWTFSPTPPLLGILIGTLTTVIFASWAIAVSGNTRPMSLLRNEPVDARSITGCQSIVLGLLLAVPFTALSSLVMESLFAGIGVLVSIVIGIAVLGGFFNGLLWVCTRLLPLPLRGFPPAGVALNSLRRRGTSLVFAMIALFIGTLSLSMGLVVMQISESRTSGPAIDIQGFNLNILAAAEQESTIRQAVQAQDPEAVSVEYRTALEGLRAAGGGPIYNIDAVLVGRSDPVDYIVNAAEWASQPDGVYAFSGANVKAGSLVEVTFQDGTTKTLTVTGSYNIDYTSNNLAPPAGLLMPAKAFTRVARQDSLTYFVRVPPDQVHHAADALGAALPQATVVNLAAYAARYMQSYEKLYILPVALAGLALLAGLLLIANSVSLAMLDRHYEIGILKTVGYSQRQIQSIFAVEYGLAGLLATGAGVLFVQGLLAELAVADGPAAGVWLLNLPSLVVTAVGGVGLTLLIVFGVTWDATRVSPLVILNDRG